VQSRIDVWASAQDTEQRNVTLYDTLRQERVLTQRAFTRLLEWLDDGTDSQGASYIEMRRRLVSYFDRRNRFSSDELADETLNRIGRTLENGVIAITPPARYCYVVARFVLLEDFRRERVHVRLDDERRGGDGSALCTLGRATPAEDLPIGEQRMDCLERCLENLKPQQRDLVIEYYRDTRRQKIERRRSLAARLGVTMNALAIRACRIRGALEACVEACCTERRQV
jgi:DNA-directed RNA polymerase specialized sigma24 family protein